MIDIKIGTLIPGMSAETMIPQLNAVGFESYQLRFETDVVALDFDEYARRISAVLDGRAVNYAIYGNTLTDGDVRRGVETLIRNAPLLNCGAIGLFAGGNPDKTVPDTIPEWKAVFEPLCEMAEAYGVKLALEGCGRGWNGGSHNLAYCPEAWDLVFDAVKSPALGLEWEPCHALEALADPIPQLRRYAPKVVHLHGKDGTVAWDVIRDYGINGIHPYMWNRTPGFGDTNWSNVFTILLQAGFSGSCDIEGYHDPVHYDDMEWTSQVRSLQYLKDCRGGREYWPGPTEYRGYQGTRRSVK